MRKTITFLLILISVSGYSQEESDGPYMGQPRKESQQKQQLLHQPDSGASGELWKFNKVMTVGLVLNFTGAGIMVYGFSLKPETDKESDLQRNSLIVGATFSFVGLFVQALSLAHIRKAALHIEEKKFALIMNENGIGLRMAIR